MLLMWSRFPAIFKASLFLKKKIDGSPSLPSIMKGVCFPCVCVYRGSSGSKARSGTCSQHMSSMPGPFVGNLIAFIAVLMKSVV